MRYYIFDEKQPNGFLEVTKGEYIALFGDAVTSPYVSKVYRGEIHVADVPAELQASVQEAVDNRINRWGRYEEAIDPAQLDRRYTETDIPLDGGNL